MIKNIIAALSTLILCFCAHAQEFGESDKKLSLLGSEDKVIKVDIHIKDHHFFPEILEVPTGKKIRITVHNHDSTIEEFESFDLKREKIVLGNSKTIVVLAPLKPGTYDFFGEFHEETAQGKIIAKEISQES